MTLLDVRYESSTFWIQLAEGAGWDVRTERGTHGEVIAHFDDWHRLERAMARMGHRLFAIDTDLPRA
jgi:hypothetical protein